MEIDELSKCIGNDVWILNFELKYCESEASIHMMLFCENGKIELICENVSDIKIDHLNVPFRFQGLAIKNTKSDGWEIERRYKIYDYEEELISFYCQDIDIIV